MIQTEDPTPPSVSKSAPVAKQTAGYDWAWADETCVCESWKQTNHRTDLSDYGNSCVDTDGSGPWCYCMQDLDWMSAPKTQMTVSHGTKGTPSQSSTWHRCTPQCNF